MSGAGQVVIFDQDRIEKASTMILATTTANGILLQTPPTGGCLAGIVDFRVRGGHSIDILPGEGSNP